MSKMLQVRNVPDEIHRTLKARAALAGMSLSEYVLRELRRRIEGRSPVTPSISPAELLAEERRSR